MHGRCLAARVPWWGGRLSLSCSLGSSAPSVVWIEVWRGSPSAGLWQVPGGLENCWQWKGLLPFQGHWTQRTSCLERVSVVWSVESITPPKVPVSSSLDPVELLSQGKGELRSQVE